MQVLKEEIKSNILLSAKILFLKDGFQKTSMQAIADKVGISKGNLYNYYKNKEDIFEILVFSSVNKLDSFTKKFIDTNFNMRDNSFSNLLVEQTIKLYDEKEGLQLVLDSSAGTKYESIIGNAIQVLAKKISYKVFRDTQNEYISFIIANNLITCIIEVIRNSTTEKELKININLFALYHENGIKALL